MLSCNNLTKLRWYTKFHGWWLKHSYNISRVSRTHQVPRLSDCNSADITPYIYRLYPSILGCCLYTAHCIWTSIDIRQNSRLISCNELAALIKQFLTLRAIYARLYACSINHTRVYIPLEGLCLTLIDEPRRESAFVVCARALTRSSHRVIHITRFCESSRRKLDVRYTGFTRRLSHGYLMMLNYIVKSAREKTRI